MVREALRPPVTTTSETRPGTARERRPRLERGLVLLIALYMLSLPFMTHDIRAADEIEYFSYLHSVAFDRDLDFTNEYAYFIARSPAKYSCPSGRTPDCNRFKETFYDRTTPTGKKPNFGPIGTAILWAPFYAAGHVAALVGQQLGLPVIADGYSKPYVWAITLGSALLALAGLLLSYQVARTLAGPVAAFWATFTIWLATPTIFYSHLAPGYSHAASLFAVSLFLYLWQRWRDRLAPWQAIALGAAGGLVAMVREQDALFLAVPVVYGAFEVVRLARASRWAAATAYVVRVALLGATAVVTFLPQVVVYYVLNGNGRPNQDVSDKMSVVPPYFLQVLLDPAHGLFIWSPILLLAVGGLLLLTWRQPRLGLALLTGFVLTWYINGAIKTWTTAGSFGARRFLNCTPLFVLGLAFAFERLRQSRAARLIPIVSLVAILWNAGLIVQFVMEYMNRQGMSWPLVARNQFVVVPRELPGILMRLVTNRNSFYEP